MVNLTMFEEIKNIPVSKKRVRNASFTAGVFLLLLAALLFWQGSSLVPYMVFGGALLLFGGITAPRLLFPFYKVWMTFAVVLGWFMTRFIVIIIFYFLITPIAFLAHLCGKRFLDFSWKSPQKSYWEKRPCEEFNRDKYELQF